MLLLVGVAFAAGCRTPLGTGRDTPARETEALSENYPFGDSLQDTIDALHHTDTSNVVPLLNYPNAYVRESVAEELAIRPGSGVPSAIREQLPAEKDRETIVNLQYALASRGDKSAFLALVELTELSGWPGRRANECLEQVCGQEGGSPERGWLERACRMGEAEFRETEGRGGSSGSPVRTGNGLRVRWLGQTQDACGASGGRRFLEQRRFIRRASNTRCKEDASRQQEAAHSAVFHEVLLSFPAPDAARET